MIKESFGLSHDEAKGMRKEGKELHIEKDPTYNYQPRFEPKKKPEIITVCVCVYVCVCVSMCVSVCLCVYV